MDAGLAERLETCRLSSYIPEHTSFDFKTLFDVDLPGSGPVQDVVDKLNTLEHRSVLYFGQFAIFLSDCLDFNS